MTNNINSRVSKGNRCFFSVAMATVSGVFFPRHASEESVKKTLSTTKNCLKRSQKNLNESEQVEASCQETIKLAL